MNNKQLVNKEYRAYANRLAAVVAQAVGKPHPKCIRINQGRGWARWHTQEFSVPAWAMSAHPSYRDYYIVHEVCHCVARTHGHDSEFQKMEDLLLAHIGLRIVREPNGPYADEIHKNLAAPGPTQPLCGKWGKPI